MAMTVIVMAAHMNMSIKDMGSGGLRVVLAVDAGWCVSCHQFKAERLKFQRPKVRYM